MRLRCGMERNRLNASGLPQALQKAVFYTLKGGLLRCNSRPFAGRKAVIRKPVG